jgi:integrase
MAIEKKEFRALMGDAPKISRKNGAPQATGKVHDGDGLYLIVGEKTQRSWLFRFTFNGKSEDMNLGSAHKLDLSGARKERERCEGLIAQNINPKSERQRSKAAKLTPDPKLKHTLYAVAKLAVVKLGPKGDERKHEDGRRYWLNRLKPENTAGLGDMRPADITRMDVVRCLQAVRERTPKGEQMRKVEQQLRLLFEWCAASGYISENAPNPADFRAERFRMLVPDVAPSVPRPAVPWRKVGAVVADLRAGGSMSALCTEWLLLSVVRASNALSANWSEIDLERKLWTIPAHKMKVKKVGPHKVPLTARHLEILQLVMPKDGKPQSGLIFPSRINGEVMDDQALIYILKEAYPEPVEQSDGTFAQVVPHGLRTTFRTWGGQQNDPVTELPIYPESVLEECMAHIVGNAARNAYVHENNLQARRTILEAWAAYVSNPNPNVVAFRAA